MNIVKISQEDVLLASSFGIDLSEKGLSRLTELQQKEVINSFYNRMANLPPSNINGSHINSFVTLETPKELSIKSMMSPELIASGKRESFKKAVEDAFWELGGVHYLVALGHQAPLEFLKIASRLINVEDPNLKKRGLHISMTLQTKPAKVKEAKSLEK